MKNIYVLRLKDQGRDASLGFYEYVSNNGYVVLANDEAQARLLASRGHGYHENVLDEHQEKYWLDAELTSCELVNPKGQSRIILTDKPTG